MRWFFVTLALGSSVISVCAGWKLEQTRLIKEILPTKAESAWAEIPWRTNLWEARKESAKVGKPIYLWEMDGHPLGCT
ncbi:MAG: hypothetical protein ACPG32_04745 [Akkermansiaceae bacterium]